MSSKPKPEAHKYLELGNYINIYIFLNIYFKQERKCLMNFFLYIKIILLSYIILLYYFSYFYICLLSLLSFIVSFNYYLLLLIIFLGINNSLYRYKNKINLVL